MAMGQLALPYSTKPKIVDSLREGEVVFDILICL